MSKTQDLIDEAISLPIEERALLVDSILRSMIPSNEENDQKWASEAKARLEELRSGKVKPIPGEEVFKEIWKRLEKKGLSLRFALPGRDGPGRRGFARV